ncbi:MAG: LPS-assembly protein LptD [Alphaproteobacteria bacterium GM202ARS2]|nr:LPS-assembly protein LptD [Alphaproteobacteria bacterium GM202ARS2]
MTAQGQTSQASLRRWLGVMMLVMYGVVLPSSAKAEKNKLYVSAESMTHREADEAIIAEGSVHLTYDGYVLSADKVVVLRGQNKVIAEGQVRLLKPSGEAIFAEYASLERDLSRGIVRAIRVALDNGERFVASESRLNPQASRRYVMSNAAYTPCRLCLSDDGEETFVPWSIAADTVVRDEEDSMVRYYNAVLSLFGIPIFYMPYYAHPDPQVVRTSGLLRPILGRSSLVGNSYGLPFYFTPNRFFDMTLTPIYYSKGGWLFDGELRWRTEKGGLTIEGSAIGSDPSATEDNQDDPSQKGNGYGRAKGQFAINEQWRWGFDAAYASDDTYLRRFDIDRSAQVLAKTIYAEGFFKNDHIDVRAIDFQDLRPEAPEDDEQLLPFFAYHYSSGPQIFGSSFQVDVESVQLVRSSERKKRRLSGEVTWQMPWLIGGHRFDGTLRVRSDAYHGDFTSDPDVSDKTDLYVVPRASLRWRYPLARYGNTTTYTLEPSWLAVLAPRDSRREGIADDEGSGFEWNDIALFQDERLVGRDRAESGKRIDYGLTLAIDGQKEQYQASFFAGQSYRFDDTNDFRQGSGLEDDLSRLLIGSSVSFADTWHLFYKGGFDIQKSGRVSHELQARAKIVNLDVSSSYRLLQKGTSAYGSKREENETRLKWDFDTIRLKGAITYDVIMSRTLAYDAAVHYVVRDCLGIGVAFQRTFTRDRDYVPSDSLTLTFNLKHLGDIAFR